MGKGDQRSRRGKTWIGTYGKTRPRKAKKVAVAKKATAKPAKKSSKNSNAPTGPTTISPNSTAKWLWQVCSS